jgi:hypothetical protein
MVTTSGKFQLTMLHQISSTMWLVLNIMIVLQSFCIFSMTDAQQQVSGQQRLSSKYLANSSSSSSDQAQNNQPQAVGNNTIDDELNSSELENYWLNQRDSFFNITSFELNKATIDLVGPEYGNQSYHLPYWFDYEMFSNVTDRSFNDTKVALKRHHIYIDNCVSIWKNNALKRLHLPNNYTFIDHAEDWTQQENYNDEWNEISLNLTAMEQREKPLAKGVRLVKEELIDCTKRRDKNMCILLLVDLDERFGPSMKLRYPFEEERYRSLLDIDAAEEAAAEFADSLLSSDGKTSYWLDRREQFFRNTTFSLSEKTRKLVENFNNNKRKYHLPYWFDYEVFKRMVGRINETPQEELKSHHRYIDSCLEIWNDTAADRLGQLDYEAVPITSHVDIPARTCLYHCNPFDYDLTEDEIRESPVEKAMRLVQEELDQTGDRKRAILLLVELEERFDFPRAKGMRYPYEQPERSREDFWKYVEDRDRAIADFVKTL